MILAELTPLLEAIMPLIVIVGIVAVLCFCCWVHDMFTGNYGPWYNRRYYKFRDGKDEDDYRKKEREEEIEKEWAIIWREQYQNKKE